jgi:hypothetical protein
MKYEFIEVTGERRENGIHNYSVSIEQLNEYGAEGWQFAYTTNEGHTVIMQRPIHEHHVLRDRLGVQHAQSA